MESTTVILIALSLLLVAAIVVAAMATVARQRLQDQIRRFSEEMVDVSADASVGHRLSTSEHREMADLARTINKLFDALGERDRKIHDRDRLFRNFARTLPEIVLIHDEKILLANDSAAALIGLDPEQLVGRDVADLVKPAYRALFRKTVTRRLEGQDVPQRLEIQLINGARAGLWVDAQSSTIEFHGRPAILTVARDVSYRKSIEVSLSSSKRQAQ
jgi:PAS domain S-box-containing protein